MRLRNPSNDRIALLAAAVLAIAVLAYGAFLVFVGQTWTVWVETPTGGAEVGRTNTPTVTGMIPVVGGAVLLAGLVLKSQPLVWIGWFVIAAFAGLFMFGVGGALVPVAVTLGLLLVIAGPRSRLR